MKIQSKNNNLEIFSDYKIKPTKLRKDMLEIIFHIGKPFCFEDVFVGMVGTGIHRATIFRNLNLFKDAGIIREIDMRQDSVFYEYAVWEHHHHVICSRCGYIEAFEMCGVDNLIYEFLRKSSSFTAIKDHSFEMFGICKKCSRPI